MQDEFIREVAFQRIPVEYHDYIWQKLGAVSYCGGFDGAVCCFAARGGRAQLGAGGAAACVFCCPDSMAALCAEAGGPSQLARRLRQMTAAGLWRSECRGIGVKRCWQSLLAARGPQRMWTWWK
ncbi:MAG: hypothetical protein NXI12_15360 [Alphaproteobacteria bacterium]|nr:hypothetical protein [Alphaproteobacteria bacterium]